MQPAVLIDIQEHEFKDRVSVEFKVSIPLLDLSIESDIELIHIEGITFVFQVWSSIQVFHKAFRYNIMTKNVREFAFEC